MEEAGQLCEQLFLWLKKQEQCIEKLLALAQALEELHLGSNTVQLVGNVVAATGFATLATILTAGLAAPLTVPLAVAGIGTAVSVAPQVIESGVSHLTIQEAEQLIKEVGEIRDTIQRLLNELRAKSASQAQGASAAASAEFEVTTQIMGALARKYRMEVPLDLLRRYNETTIINQQRLVRSDPGVASLPLITGGAALLMGLNTTGKGVARNIGLICMETAIKQTVLAVGSFAGLALSAWDLGRNIEEIKTNKTEASRSLRNTAREMKENAEDLRRKIDALLEIIKKLSEFRTLLENLGGYSLTKTEDGQKVLNFIKATCHDKTILSWVDRNQAHFLNLFRFLRDYLLKPLEREIKKRKRRHVDIVFVGHGGITAEFMPASVLVPTPSITDTILYSPWNCVIDARAASGIAEGCIKLHHRIFYEGEPRTTVNYDQLPQRWNSMRQSAKEVPQILLGPVKPDEPVWRGFERLGGYVCRDDRFIIPYLQHDNNAPHIPFYMLIFGASHILMFTRVTATVHLAACLVRRRTESMRREWKQQCAAQYAYTEDGTVMSMNTEATNVDPSLLRALRMMFDIHNQQ